MVYISNKIFHGLVFTRQSMKWLYGDNSLFILDEKNISNFTEAILNVLLL